MWGNEGVAAQVAALRRRLDPPELEPLKVLMLLWAQQVAQRQLNLDLGIKDMAEVDRLHESGELEVRFSERALAEQEKYRAQGRAQGIAAERGLLLRLAARKFDAGTSGRLGNLLSRIDDPETLAEVGDRIIECTSGEELISRVGRIARSGS